MKEIFDFGFAQIKGIKVGHSSKFFDFLVYCLIAGNVDEGAVSSVYNPKITHEIDQVIGIDLIFETFDFHDS